MTAIQTSAPGTPVARRGRLTYLGGRVAEYLLVVFVALTLNFLLPRALPGGPLKLFG